MSSTPSDPFLAAAFWAGLSAFVLALLLSATILGLRMRLRRREAHWQAFVARWRPALLEVILDPRAPAQLPHLAPRERTMFLRLWAYLHESVRGDAVTRLNDTALDLGVDATARRLLVHGNRTERLQAVLAAGYLRDAQAWDALVTLARSPDSLVAVNAARALVRINPLRAANGLMPLLVTRQEWDLGRIAGFLAEARQPFWLLLAKIVPHLQPHELPRALLLGEALRVQLPDATLARLLQPNQPANVVQAALRLAHSLALADDVRRCLGHADAGVREQAALRLAGSATPDDSMRLCALLDDPEWRVRLAAARTLARLPFVSTPQLEALMREHPASADILRQVAAERESA